MVGTTEEILDPARCSTEEAIRAARLRASEDPSYELQVTQFLNNQWMSRRINMPVIERGMEVLAAIGSPGRVFGVLRTALAQSDPELRSKAALALGRNVDSIQVLEKLIIDEDARVRANTVEAVWGRKTPEAEALLRRALDDCHHRVVTNAAYGLYLIDPTRYAAQLEMLIHHADAAHRMAAAWLLRKIGDGQHLSLLKPLVRDPDPDVRKAAFRTLSQLRGAGKAAAVGAAAVGAAAAGAAKVAAP